MTEAIQLIREEFVRIVHAKVFSERVRSHQVNMFDLASAAALKRWNDQRAARIDSVLEGDK